MEGEERGRDRDGKKDEATRVPGRDGDDEAQTDGFTSLSYPWGQQWQLEGRIYWEIWRGGGKG